MLIATASLCFVLAAAWAVLFPAVETDLWIALASGRWIVEHREVPRTDPFSYTFAGQPWFNQNWLSHLLFYVLYARVGPIATIVATWFAAAVIFGLIAYRSWRRTGSLLASLIASSLAAIACRGFLDPRPATFGLILLAIAWTLLHAMSDLRHPRRPWPAVALAFVLTIWGCAHGSFVFGYEIVALFVASALISRLFFPRLAQPSSYQLIAVSVAAALAFTATAAFGPYHLSNFTHPLTVAGSSTWRLINEWQPPWVPGLFLAFTHPRRHSGSRSRLLSPSWE